MAGAREQSRETVLGYIKRQLGHPVLCVELTDDHFEDAVDDAEIFLATHLGNTRSYDFTMTSGVSEYDVPNDCEHVVDVAFSEKRQNLDLILNPSAFGDVNELPYSYYSSTMGGGFNSGLYQFLQYNEMTQRTLSADNEWMWDRHRRKLIIQPNGNTGPARFWYLTTVCDYSHMPVQQYHMLRRYAIARAMYALGLIRSKYSSVPAAGGEVTLNGSELISNAQLEMSDLLEAARNLAPPPPFFTG